MKQVTIPYSPGYSEALMVWATHLWVRQRRARAWWLVLLGVDVLLIWRGIHGWFLWVDTGMAASLALVALVPLAFRVVWARKIRELGICELEVADTHLAVQGAGVRVESPLRLYDAVMETPRYFILTRFNGLFSFIPKTGVATDVLDCIRSVLHAGIVRQPER